MAHPLDHHRKCPRYSLSKPVARLLLWALWPRGLYGSDNRQDCGAQWFAKFIPGRDHFAQIGGEVV